MRVISQKLRDSARGQDCTLQLVGVCNHRAETTVLAHLPCGMGGMGMKSPDVMAVFACSDCHSEIDHGGINRLTAREILRAIAKTQMHWIESGLMTIKGMK